MTRFEIVEQIKKAILKGNKSYMGVRLPSPQGSGTSMQKSTFARMKAEDVYDQFITY